MMSSSWCFMNTFAASNIGAMMTSMKPTSLFR